MKILARSTIEILCISIVAACDRASAQPLQETVSHRSPISAPKPATLSATNFVPAASHYIFTLKPGVDAQSLAKEFGLTPNCVFHHALNGFAADVPIALSNLLKQLDTRIIAIEPDGPIRPALCTLGRDYNFPAPAGQQVTSAGLWRMGINDFPLACMDGSDQRIDVNVAVLDTGVDWYYGTDLNIVQPIDFGDPNYDGEDWTGHGTAVAGIIGALDNGYGAVGVAPGARIWDLQIQTPISASWANVLAAMDYVVQHADEIEIANASFEGTSSQNFPEVAIETAVSNAVARGIVFVAAAGNDSIDVYGLDGVFGTDDVLPAALPEALTVSSMGPLCDEFASSSNFSAGALTGC